MKRYIFKSIVILSIIFSLFWVISYIHCEVLTNMHGYEFKNLYEQTGIISEVDNWKVLKYSERSADVYYSSKLSGNIIYFKKENDNWVLVHWKTIWSKFGSADEFMWPYIR